jgi:hypothetical protein
VVSTAKCRRLFKRVLTVVRITPLTSQMDAVIVRQLAGTARLRRPDRRGRIGRVLSRGDELYKLKGIPGVWDEQCLEAARTAPS